MKQLIPFVKSHIYNSTKVIQDLKNLYVPENALIFSADATSMYTNIDTEIGVASIRDLILQNHEALHDNFPTELFLQVLKIVMNNNIFTFEKYLLAPVIRNRNGYPISIPLCHNLIWAT
jgi:hypothetical protein